jgi:serine/threonine protein kinase/Tol biopolymer transport system component
MSLGVPLQVAIGTRIGPYEIAGWLGAGGMGEVYRAHDSRLDREVAVKLIREAFAPDTNRVHRFEQEARSAGQLNHPNILAVHDVGVHAGAPYIVSELLEGEALRRRLERGAVNERKALDYARQIAEGLAAAHDRGIVHRDLKPENLFITSEGRIKILDFGIAKLTRDHDDTPRQTGGPTETEPGMVVGTPGYMSPEQVRGEPVDPRSDLFSFGTILYEMLTGRPPFTRRSAAETMAAILNAEPPPLTTTPASGGPGAPLERIIVRCLEKAREARFQSARDLAFALEVLSGTTATAVPALTSDRHRWLRERFAWGVAAIAALAAAVIWATSPRSPAAGPLAYVLSDVPSEGASLATEEAPAVAPDGRQLVYVAYDATGKRLLYRRVLGTFAAAQALPKTDGASLPFWSPTSESIGFFAQGKLKTLNLVTGQMQVLWDAGGPRGGTWNKDDVILFVPNPPDGPYRIAAAGGAATPVASGGGRAWLPSFLPDGRHFLIFVPVPHLPENSAVYVGSLDSPARKRVLTSRSNAVYVAPGYLLFWRETTLMAQSFDARTQEVQGNPIAVAPAVGLNPITNQALFSVSTSGTLVFFAGAVGQSELVWLDRTGEQIDKPHARGAFTTISLSPDATSVIFDAADARTASMDLWQLIFARGEPSKLTFNPGHDVFPLWSPDGGRIAFASMREDGPPQLYERDANSVGNEKVLLKSNFPKVPSGWSRDGRLLIYSVIDPRTGGDIWALPLAGTPYPVVNDAADERYGTLSPDGRWLAYISNETGAYEVFVRAFADATVLRQVTTRGGFQPQWRGDGEELFYLAPDKTLMAIGFRSSPTTFDAMPPKALFATRTKWLEMQATARNYAAAPDGQRFLVANATQEAQSASITVALNWTAALRK